MIDDFRTEYRRYRAIGERALAQLPDEALNRVPSPDGNSAAMIVRHMGGNLASRFTDFLTTDGEKPWRARDEEFAEATFTRAEMHEWWVRGWDVLDLTLATLTDADLTRAVTIRQQPLSVHAALARSLSHVSYHVGQLVLLARIATGASWQWISIPRGGSDAYNAAPTKEKGLA
jgi:uncharacterized damage-inducible protein DinB